MIWTSDYPYIAFPESEVLLSWVAFMGLSYALFIISKRFTDNGKHVVVERTNFGKEISLRQALWGYFKHPTASLFLALVVGMWSLRIYIGNWTWRDLLTGGLIVFFWPIVEWVVHVHILHARPRKIFGFTYDPLFAQIHRAHHRNPYHPDYGIVPAATLVQYCLLIPGVFFIFIVWPRPLTMGAMAATMAFRYELWHYLIHSAYKPKSKWFRKLRDRHWWHHFQHEDYWYGITTMAGDVVFRTNPHPKDVPLSPTVRTLGHDDTVLAAAGEPAVR